MKERMEFLAKELERANFLYYVQDSPEIPDFEYDAMLRELEELEAEFPQFKYEDSPTQMVGGAASKLFSEVVHTVKMESLQDVFNFDELKSTIQKREVFLKGINRSKTAHPGEYDVNEWFAGQRLDYRFSIARDIISDIYESEEIGD